MSLNYMIVVDDGGEMKSVLATEIDTQDKALGEALERVLNDILDAKAIAAGTYDPSDNDTPMVFV